MNLEALDHVGLAVSDVNRSMDWYQSVLGLQRAFEEAWGTYPAVLVTPGTNGQSGTGVARAAPVLWLPGQVPVKPPQRRPDHRALMPAPRHDLPANPLGGTAQRLAHRRGLLVPGPATQKVNTADADADLGMIAEADQGVLRPGLAAAPASALVSLGFHCLGLSAHGGSRLLQA
jgi:catechol 2,3-dioxygenase-like lactoylglutathione lyase family enzyme